MASRGVMPRPALPGGEVLLLQRRTSQTMASFSGVGTPAVRPASTMAPLITSISVRRPASTSCSIDALAPIAFSSSPVIAGQRSS